MPVTVQSLSQSSQSPSYSPRVSARDHTPLTRWVTFNAIGVAGMVVQLGVVAALVHLGCHYLLATVIGVESAIVHNFVWHRRWTWRDRPEQSSGETVLRVVRFHFLN